MRLRVRLLVAFSAGVLVGVAVMRSVPRRAPPPDVRAPESPLGRVVASAKFTQTPLNQALAGLSESAGVRITLQAGALEAYGIDPTEPVTLDASGMRLAQVLAAICEYVRTPTERVDFVEEAGGVVVTTESALPAVVRVYDVRDLIDASAASTRPADGESSTRPEDWLIEAMWYAARFLHSPGGELSPVRIVDGRAVVRTDAARHRRVAELLATLRARAAPAR